eukprot:TRINITY_DN56257_c0_g1_i1.p1 TRINITY_DN56257_c0_g1~~TRINITY_DN56257_c0_g1_i1.p1  ORF type:complete len:691 (+),score=94.81 TRINITY_DN56257_c0_g1_i1:178-2073(+)
MPTAQALAIDRQGKIRIVGSKEDVLKHQGWFTHVENFPGTTVLPGFIDPHMHTAVASLQPWIDLGIESGDGCCATLDAAFEKLKSKADDFFHNNKFVNGFVLAHNLSPALMSNDESHMKKDDITMALLDNVTSHPLFVVEANGHFAYANSAGFAKAFPDKLECIRGSDTRSCLPDPDGGSYYRSADGRLTGKLAESPAMDPFKKFIHANLHVPSAYFEMLTSIMNIFKRASRNGVTSVQDMGLGLSNTAMVDALLADIALTFSKPLVRYTARVSAFANTSSLHGAKPWGPLLTVGHPFHKIHSITGVKMWSDGSNQAESGAQFEPYVGTNNSGKLNWNMSTLKDVINSCNRRGWSISIHANGNRAIDVSLRAFEEAASESCGDGVCEELRHRIEHSSLANKTQLDMMKRLGVSPSFLIGHVYYYGKALRNVLGQRRLNDLDRLASALARGLRISMHSDYDVTDINPLRMIETAVVRKMKYADGILNPEERITRTQAIRAVTIDAAWQCHMDDITGSLKAGKFADLVVLRADPFTVPETEIHDIVVQGTYLQGVRAYWKDAVVTSEAVDGADACSTRPRILSTMPAQDDLQSFVDWLLKLSREDRDIVECMLRRGDVPQVTDEHQEYSERII